MLGVRPDQEHGHMAGSYQLLEPALTLEVRDLDVVEVGDSLNDVLSIDCGGSFGQDTAQVPLSKWDGQWLWVKPDNGRESIDDPFNLTDVAANATGNPLRKVIWNL